jgi:hypothetical protein
LRVRRAIAQSMSTRRQGASHWRLVLSFFFFLLLFVAWMVVILLMLRDCLFLCSVELRKRSWKVPVIRGKILAGLVLFSQSVKELHERTACIMSEV